VAVLPIGPLRVRGRSRQPENECKQEAVQPGQLHDFGTAVLANNPGLGRKVRSWLIVAEVVVSAHALQKLPSNVWSWPTAATQMTHSVRLFV
jgi:hypothetical protein